MTISWGYKITAVYLVFVAGILFLVFKANQQKFDLVTEDYYGEELKYQNVIDQKSNVSALSAAPSIRHSVDHISIQFPQEFQGKALTGEVYLYRPSDASKDIKKVFTVNGTDLQIALPAALSGTYELKLSWNVNGKSFYNEQKIIF
jgi:hypothetical protein